MGHSVIEIIAGIFGDWRKNLWGRLRSIASSAQSVFSRYSICARCRQLFAGIFCDESGSTNILVGPAGIVFAIGRTRRGEFAGYSPGETPRCRTGKMPVLRCDYTNEHRISWNLARIRRHIFLAVRTR
jgi:hypothetical protein